MLTSNEHDSFDSLAKNGYERQDEHDVFLREALDATPHATLRTDGCLQSYGELDTPLLLELSDAKQGNADDGDDDGSDQAEGALIRLLGSRPPIRTDGIEGSDQAAGDDQTD